MNIAPFDPGTKRIDSYTAEELLAGAEDQVRLQYETYADKRPVEVLSGEAPQHAVAIDCGGDDLGVTDDSYMLVSYMPSHQFIYYFARSDQDFAKARNRDEALLALKVLMRGLRSRLAPLPEWMAAR